MNNDVIYYCIIIIILVMESVVEHYRSVVPLCLEKTKRVLAFSPNVCPLSQAGQHGTAMASAGGYC